MQRATGTFDVKIAPLAADDRPEAAALGRLAIDKTFHGDLEGTSVGQMLAYRSAVEGSAGYVAIELVTATLEGRKGQFALQHSGQADKGAQSLSVEIIADSGTDGLAGISGTMQINAEGGHHDYIFDYALPPV